MPYTLLQALGYVAQHDSLHWERIFSPPNSPRYPIMIKINKSKNIASSYIDRSCKLQLSRRDGVAKKSMLVFKRRRGLKGRACGDACLSKKRGTIGCKVCGKFVEMWVDELEKKVPGLKEAEKVKDKEVGESDSGYSSMCEG